MKKGDVGIVKCFSKEYRNKGRAFNYLQSESYIKMPVSAWCYIPTSLPPEPFTILGEIQALNTNRPVKRWFVTPFYTAIVVLFQAFPASWGNNQSHANISLPSSTVHTTKYLNPYHRSHIGFSCLFSHWHLVPPVSHELGAPQGHCKP